MSRKSFVVVLLGILAVLAYLTKSMWRPADPAVVVEVTKLRKLSHAPLAPREELSEPTASSHAVSVAPPSVLANALALSSFLPTEGLYGLSAEQLAKLELLLQDARRATYALLLEKARISPQSDGGIHIEIPAQGDGLKELRDFVYESIEEIVGHDRMASLEDSLGSKFDAHFAYFGAYETKIDLSVERRPSYPAASRDLVTMRNQYDGMRILGGIGRISSTHVLYLPQFEGSFFPLGGLKPKD